MEDRSEEVDLEGFPLIPLHQIPVLRTPTLRRCLQELKVLLESMEPEGESSALFSFVIRQKTAVIDEMQKRYAQERVRALLAGLPPPEEDPLLVQPEELEVPAEKSHKTQESTNGKSSLQDDGLVETKPQRPRPPSGGSQRSTPRLHIPLPSELKRKESLPKEESAPSLGSKNGKQKSEDINHTAEAQYREEKSVGSEQTHGFNICSSASSPSSARSKRGPRRPSQEVVFDMDEEEHQKKWLMKKQKATQKQLAKNWGQAFVIQSTRTKPTRRLPKKKKEESMEQIMEREKAKRRKLAIQRLEERKKRRQQQQEEKRKQRERAKAKAKLEAQKKAEELAKAQQAAIKAGNLPIVDETEPLDLSKQLEGPAPLDNIVSSDSESVSGGDDSDDSSAQQNYVAPAIPQANLSSEEENSSASEHNDLADTGNDKSKSNIQNQNGHPENREEEHEYSSKNSSVPGHHDLSDTGNGEAENNVQNQKGHPENREEEHEYSSKIQSASQAEQSSCAPTEESNRDEETMLNDKCAVNELKKDTNGSALHCWSDENGKVSAVQKEQKSQRNSANEKNLQSDDTQRCQEKGIKKDDQQNSRNSAVDNALQLDESHTYQEKVTKNNQDTESTANEQSISIIKGEESQDARENDSLKDYDSAKQLQGKSSVTECHQEKISGINESFQITPLVNLSKGEDALAFEGKYDETTSEVCGLGDFKLDNSNVQNKAPVSNIGQNSHLEANAQLKLESNSDLKKDLNTEDEEKDVNSIPPSSSSNNSDSATSSDSEGMIPDFHQEIPSKAATASRINIQEHKEALQKPNEAESVSTEECNSSKATGSTDNQDIHTEALQKLNEAERNSSEESASSNPTERSQSQEDPKGQPRKAIDAENGRHEAAIIASNSTGTSNNQEEEQNKMNATGTKESQGTSNNQEEEQNKISLNATGAKKLQEEDWMPTLEDNKKYHMSVAPIRRPKRPKNMLGGAPEPRKYSEIYPSFQSILSGHYEKKAGRGFKGLTPLEEENALQHQWKQYSVFSSVMKDYATVFSSGKSSGANSQGEQNKDEESHRNSLIYEGNSYSLHYGVKSTRSEVYDIITDAFGKIEDWSELPTGLGLKTTWNLLWTWSRPRISYSSLLCWQRVNHFPGSRELTRKDLLKRHIQRYQNINNVGYKAFDITPQTFILPHEFTHFVTAFTKTQSEKGSAANIWIMKPVGLSRGRGISLVNDIASVVYSETMVVQRYIPNPLLLDGYKFDLRIYVLVTSFNPLEAFIYKEGFVRMSLVRYSSNLKDISNKEIHLTNSSIQKVTETEASKDNPLNQANSDEAGGTKLTLSYLWKRLAKEGKDCNKLWASMCEVILKSLVAVEDHIPFQPNSFELFGYDILFDDSLKPWLIEVNASPQMNRDNQLDHQVKNPLIVDTIALVNPVQFDREALLAVLEKRLQQLQQKQRPFSTADSKKSKKSFGIFSEIDLDLSAILRGQMPRAYGEIPDYLGGYERLCPSTAVFEKVLKVKKALTRRKLGPET